MSFFYENKCCGRESVGASWIWTFLSSRSSWGVRVPPELLPLLLQLDVTKWPTTIDRQKKQIQSDQEKIDRQKTNTKWPTTIDCRENKYKTTKNKLPDNHWPIRKENNRNKLVKMTKIRHTSSLGWEDPVVFGFVEKEMEVMGHWILNKKIMCLIWTRRYKFALWSFYRQPDLKIYN